MKSILILLLILFETNMLSSQVQKDTCVIPTQLKYHIKEGLSKYRIPNKNDYVHGWEISLPEITNPFICSSDFNGDGYVDYALIMMKRDSTQCFLIICNGNKKGFRHYFVDTFKNINNAIQAILSVHKKGIIKTAMETLIIKNDAVFVNLYEESLSKAYYWKNNKYKKILFD